MKKKREKKNWTTADDLKTQVERLWQRGLLTAALVGRAEVLPRRLTFTGPVSRELNQCFTEVRHWLAGIRKMEERGLLRVVWCEVNNRVIGRNSLPKEVWLDSLENGLALIGRIGDGRRLRELTLETGKRLPQLVDWLEQHGLRGLEHAGEWSRLLDVVLWLREHPRPDIYLRQVDLPGIHTKFIERHRKVLAELLDLVLPVSSIDEQAVGIRGFCRRYGFRDKPLLVRFRLLDPDPPPAVSIFGQDITITAESFSRLDLVLEQVFITENEINFLAFPPLTSSMVIFGRGYGFEMFSGCDWLHGCQMYYWGDIDTHGFAILDQLRLAFPEASSLLMNRETLLAHRSMWGREPKQEQRNLPGLTSEEQQLYDDLRSNRLAESVRLEQEKISYVRLEEALMDLCAL